MKLRKSIELLKHMFGELGWRGTLTIKIQSAMRPLVPLLVMVPFLLGAAWLLRDVAVIHHIPVLSSLFNLAIFMIVGIYGIHYRRFATQDPDRLQSEQIRVRMR